MADIEQKKRIRSGHRISAERMVTQVYNTLGETSVNLSKLKQLKTAISIKLDTLVQLDEQLLSLLTDEKEISDEIVETDEWRCKLELAIIDAEAALLPSPTPKSSSTSTSSPSRTPSPSGAAVPKVKLPKLTLNNFEGDPTTWVPFWDSFESTIHNNPQLSAINKFNYLHPLLKKSALQAVAGLKITAANYDEAVAILKKRFGDKQKIIDKHMETLLHLDTVPSHNLGNLREFVDKVESHVRGLRALDVPSSSYGTLLSSIVMSKLPPDVRLVISRQEEDDKDRDFDKLLERVGEEVKARERAGSMTHQHSTSRRTTRERPSALHTGGAVLSCVYCGQGHHSETCKSVSDIEERKQWLKKAGRCFICLRKFHIQRNCRSALRCSVCNERHHISICQKASCRPTQTGTSDETTSSMYASIRTPVLLQTTRVRVLNPADPDNTLETRLLFDSGSQRSYVTNHLKDQLRLKKRSSDTLMIRTFGSTEERVQICDIVDLIITSRNGENLQFSFLSVPFICEPLMTQPLSHVVESFPHLRELDLADTGGEADINVLVGVDIYWELVTGRVVHGQSGPTAIETSFGWVLSGPADVGMESVVYLSTHTLHTFTHSLTAGTNLDTQLMKFWDLETLGIQRNEPYVYEEFTEMITFKDGRYEVHLPWKEPRPPLEDHYQLSLDRLNSLLRRLRKTPELLREYNAVIQEQLAKGIVELVPESEVISQSHYIPHHAVLRHDRDTTKLHIVYDASVKTEGPSLNDCLYVGPPFGQYILDIIIRFRLHNIALVGDIEKAFLMVSITKEDRDVLRFLWVDDPTKENPKVIILRFARVVFGVSAFSMLQ